MLIMSEASKTFVHLDVILANLRQGALSPVTGTGRGENILPSITGSHQHEVPGPRLCIQRRSVLTLSGAAYVAGGGRV